MSEDKELVEVWRKQFEEWYGSIYMNSPVERDSDSYVHAHISSNWNTWIAAKRSQPIVDMSLGQVVVLNDFDRGYNQAITDACIRLTAAGIKYTIGE